MEVIRILKYLILFSIITISVNMILKMFIESERILMITLIISIVLTTLFLIMDYFMITKEGFEDENTETDKPMEENAMESKTEDEAQKTEEAEKIVEEEQTVFDAEPKVSVEGTEIKKANGIDESLMSEEEIEIMKAVDAAFDETATRPETEIDVANRTAKDVSLLKQSDVDESIESEIREETKKIILKDRELDRRQMRDLLLKVNEALIRVNTEQERLMKAKKEGKTLEKVKEEEHKYTYLPIELWGANPNSVKSVFQQSSCDCPNQSAWTSNYMKL